MNKQDDQSAPRYVVVEGDRYVAERDAFVFQLIRVPGPDYADRWVKGLRIVVENLADFPGPLSHSRDEDASDLYRREVRRLLYHGPNRRSKQPARILFTLTPPASDDPNGETVIFLLRLLRGDQSLRGEEDEDTRL